MKWRNVRRKNQKKSGKKPSTIELNETNAITGQRRTENEKQQQRLKNQSRNNNTQTIYKECSKKRRLVLSCRYEFVFHSFYNFSYHSNIPTAKKKQRQRIKKNNIQHKFRCMEVDRNLAEIKTSFLRELLSFCPFFARRFLCMKELENENGFGFTYICTLVIWQPPSWAWQAPLSMDSVGNCLISEFDSSKKNRLHSMNASPLVSKWFRSESWALLALSSMFFCISVDFYRSEIYKLNSFLAHLQWNNRKW